MVNGQEFQVLKIGPFRVVIMCKITHRVGYRTHIEEVGLGSLFKTALPLVGTA